MTAATRETVISRFTNRVGGRASDAATSAARAATRLSIFVSLYRCLRFGDAKLRLVASVYDTCRAVSSVREPRKHLLIKIISGGQTGVDRAALDAAMASGLTVGGWCPKGRRAEDGTIPQIYPLQETPEASYPVRTTWNVRDSDGTLVLWRGEPSRGTGLTQARAKALHKPLYVLDLTLPVAPAAVADWIREHSIGVLNVAGPRESESPGIYEAARKTIHQILAHPGVLN